jgi:hypothetical protein
MRTRKPSTGKDQAGKNVVKSEEPTETMNEIFDLKQQPQTFSKEVKRERLSDAWGKKK